MPPRPSLAEMFLVALRLGCTSFGGPVAHLGFFREEYVVRRGWLDDAHYADLVALCQFLPGPASSQAVFGVGYLQRGFAGGLLSWLGFTLPSALLMIGFAYGVSALGDPGAAGWLRGLKTAAVAVVVQAVWLMSRNLCPDWPRRGIALAAAGLLLWLPFAWTQVAAIAAGSVVGWLALRSGPSEKTHRWPAGAPGGSAVPAVLCLVSFFLLLVVLPAVARATGYPWLDMFDRFYRAGALVFGGGHVILPLLEREVVAPGWLTHDQFLAGYGAAQALPGPLFTLSAYLGTVMTHGPGGWAGGLWALVAISLPALLVVAGTLPFWQGVRGHSGGQAALRGANAVVVGLLLAALYDPVGVAGVTDGRSLGLAIAGFLALQFGRIPVWGVVIAAAISGAALL